MGAINGITWQIIGAAFKIHSNLGPGLLEKAYKECMFYELQKTGLFAKKEYSLPLVYGDVKLSIGYRVDLMVERKVIVEIKSVGQLTDVHAAQVLTYLKLSKCKIGLLLNFNVADKKRNQALYIVTVQICDSSVKSAVTIFASQTSNSGL